MARSLFAGALLMAVLAPAAISTSLAVASEDRWAIVDEDGTLIRGFGVTSSQRSAAGRYVVTFSRNVSKCVPVAALGRTGTGVNFAAGSIAAAPDTAFNTRIEVITYGTGSNTPADRGFNLFVGCKPSS